MIWISQHFIRVLGGARGLPGWHFLASPPPSSPFTRTPPVPFSLAPYCCLGNKAHCFSPLYACASPRAAPACCACALLPKLGWGKKKGRRDWRRERPRGAFCNRPRACTFLIPLLRFLRFPMLLFLVILHPMLRIGEPLGYWDSLLPRRVLSQMNLKGPSNSHCLTLVALLLISLFVLTPLPTTKNIWFVVMVVAQNLCWSSQQ